MHVTMPSKIQNRCRKFKPNPKHGTDQARGRLRPCEHFFWVLQWPNALCIEWQQSTQSSSSDHARELALKNTRSTTSPSGQVDHATPTQVLSRFGTHEPINTVEHFREQTEFRRWQRGLLHLSHCLHKWARHEVGVQIMSCVLTIEKNYFAIHNMPDRLSPTDAATRCWCARRTEAAACSNQ